MITLYGGGPNFGLPETSPYVTKSEVQLQMAGLAYRKATASPDRSPKGQLPFIDDDGALIADSTFIRTHLERKYGVDLDAGLTARERAEAWAIERMVENHLSWTLGHARFFIPENFAKGPAHFFDQAPEAMRPQLIENLQSQVAATFRAVGITRHAADEIEGLGGRSLEALAALLGDKPFLMGDRPTGSDAVTFAALGAALTPFFDSPIRRRAERYGSLVAYVDRMMRRYYPGFAWGMADAA